MEKKYLVATFLIFISLNIASAQTPSWKWIKDQGALNTISRISDITTDANGNSYAAGTFNGDTLRFGSFIITRSDFTIDAFIVKHDTLGNALWVKHIISSGYPVITGIAHSADGIYVSGFFRGATVTFDTITLTNYSSPTTDAFLVKYDTAGNVIWGRSIGGTYDEDASSVATDDDGNIYTSGTYSSSDVIIGTTALTLGDYGATSSDVYLTKYDRLGNAIWTKTCNGPNFVTHPHVTYSSSGIFLGGMFNGDSLVTDSIVLHNANSSTVAPTFDFFFVKYNTSGNVVWAKRDGGTGGEQMTSITSDFSGLYVTGKGFESIIGSDTSTNNMLIIKYDHDGNFIWLKGAGSIAEAWAIKSNATGIYVTGSFNDDTIVFGADTLIKTTNYIDDDDIFLFKYDANGNPLWAKSAGGGSVDQGYALGLSENGIYWGGYADSHNIHFDSDTLLGCDCVSGGNCILAYIGTPNSVWPGDADHSSIVNNNDLLPIGLNYGQTGLSRTAGVSNLWQAYPSGNWSSDEINGSNLKHADCNGDGIIDNNDTLAVNLNFSLVHAISFIHDDTKALLPELYFVTSASSYAPGETVDAEVWMGTSADPVSDLYGISLNVDYNSSFVEPGTELMTYSASWLGTPGTNAIKISKVDPLVNTVYGAIVRIDHLNASGYGKIADLKFKLKNTITATDSIHFHLTDYMAVDAVGSPLSFHDIPLAVQVTAGTVGIRELENTVAVSVYPNPYSSFTTISYSLDKKSEVSIEVYNTIGVKVAAVVNALQTEGEHSYQFSAKEKGLNAGVYFVKITIDGKRVMKKIVEM